TRTRSALVTRSSSRSLRPPRSSTARPAPRGPRSRPRPHPERPRYRLARGEVDRGDLAGLDPERGIEVLRRRTRPDDEDVGLVGVAHVAGVARDHLQPAVAPQEPAADALDPAQRLDRITHVDAHLGALV